MTLDDKDMQQAKGQHGPLKRCLPRPALRSGESKTGLTGDAATQHTITETVLQQSVEVMAEWRDGASPRRMVLPSYSAHVRTGRDRAPRRRRKQCLPPRRRLLMSLIMPSCGQCELPLQQREAFILHQGERLNPRLLGVAMDCSITAAQVHLDAATTPSDKPAAGILIGADSIYPGLCAAHAA